MLETVLLGHRGWWIIGDVWCLVPDICSIKEMVANGINWVPLCSIQTPLFAYPDEKSSYLTAFNTHHSRYRFLCMPFGLKMSQDIFQMWMDQVTDCLPSIIAIHDDIWIYSCTPEEHDQYLLKLMKTAIQHGVFSVAPSARSGNPK